MTPIRLLLLAAIAYVIYETVQGARTGQISYRALKGDRTTAPATYWFLMAPNLIIIFCMLLAALGVYGEPL